MIPGLPLVGARYYQEVAPKVAMDRAEILSVSDTFETPAGKKYAPGVGLLNDGDLKLVKYGLRAAK